MNKAGICFEEQLSTGRSVFKSSPPVASDTVYTTIGQIIGKNSAGIPIFSTKFLATD